MESNPATKPLGERTSRLERFQAAPEFGFVTADSCTAVMPLCAPETTLPSCLRLAAEQSINPSLSMLADGTWVMVSRRLLCADSLTYTPGVSACALT